MPLVTGLYTMLLPMAVFAVLGSSRHLVVAADSATAAILAAALAGLAAPGSERYVRLAGLAALLTGAMLLLARLIRLSFLANFLSRTVLVGFLTGVGIQVAVGQLPDMLGVTVPGTGTVPVLADTRAGAAARARRGRRGVGRGDRDGARDPGGHPPHPRAADRRRARDRRQPGARPRRHGVAVVGTVPRGLPSLALPALDRADATALLGAAVSMFVVILAQSAATSRAYAAKYDEPLQRPR